MKPALGSATRTTSGALRAGGEGAHPPHTSARPRAVDRACISVFGAERGRAWPITPRLHRAYDDEVTRASRTRPIGVWSCSPIPPRSLQRDDVARLCQPARLELAGKLSDDVPAPSLRGPRQRRGQRRLDVRSSWPSVDRLTRTYINSRRVIRGRTLRELTRVVRELTLGGVSSPAAGALEDQLRAIDDRVAVLAEDRILLELPLGGVLRA